MKIVQFEDGKYAVRKWVILPIYADKNDFARWGWWLWEYKAHYKVDTLEEAERLLATVKGWRDYGKAI